MSVFVNNLDDFIIPSQACINPLVANKREEAALKVEQDKKQRITSDSSGGGGGIAKISIESDLSVSEYDVEVRPDLIKTRVTGGGSQSQKVATVSLNDCLACSGCVTSAESVLIQEQSYSKLLDELKYPSSSQKCIVVTFSPQTVASLAAFMDAPSVIDTFLRLASYLKAMGVKYVIDAAAGGDVVLLEAREEFVHRWQASRGVRNPTWDSPPISSPFSATRNIPQGCTTPVPVPSVHPPSSLETDLQPLPVVASHCPGFVCYAEKTTPQLLPYVSRVKSAQQVIGTVLKCILTQPPLSTSGAGSEKYSGIGGRILPYDAQDIYHVSIQPCFDKKLEGSRQDFFHEELEAPEVDLVLSTTEFWRLLEDSYRKSVRKHNEKEDIVTKDESSGDSNQSIERKDMIEFINSFPLDSPHGSDEVEGLFRVVSRDGQRLVNAVDANAGSGGFSEYLFKFAAQRLFDQDVWTVPLEYKVGRNADTAEVTLTDPRDGSTLLTFSRMYGFRNIQSLVLKMKRKRVAALDYVELMACPSGCVNGGGQIKTAVTEHPSETALRVEKTQHYLHSVLEVGKLDESSLVKYLYGVDIGHDKGSKFRPNYLFHTMYHAIPKLETVAPLAAKW